MKSDREFGIIFPFLSFGLLYWLAGFIAFDIFEVKYIDYQVYYILILPIATVVSTLLYRVIANTSTHVMSSVIVNIQKRHPLLAKSIIFGFYFWVGNVFAIALLTFLFPQYDTILTENLELVYSIVYCPICTAIVTFLYSRNQNRIALTHRAEAFILGGIGIISWITGPSILVNIGFGVLSELLYIVFPIIIIVAFLFLQGLHIRNITIIALICANCLITNSCKGSSQVAYICLDTLDAKWVQIERIDKYTVKNDNKSPKRKCYVIWAHKVGWNKDDPNKKERYLITRNYVDPNSHASNGIKLKKGMICKIQVMAMTEYLKHFLPGKDITYYRLFDYPLIAYPKDDYDIYETLDIDKNAIIYPKQVIHISLDSMKNENEKITR